MSKISFEEVLEKVKSEGFTLISSTYQNLNTPLTLKCPQGHEFDQTYKLIRSDGCRCPFCKPSVSLDKTDIPQKSDSYRILALDQATLNTGWSLWDDKTMVGHGVIKIPHLDTPERIEYLRHWTETMISQHKPDLAIIEDIQLQDFGSNNKASYARFDNVGITTFKTLAKLQGVLENLFIEKKIPYKIVLSGTWRKVVGVKGRKRPDQKRSAQLIVENLFNLTVTDDEADAICIGKYGSMTFKKEPIMLSWE